MYSRSDETPKHTPGPWVYSEEWGCIPGEDLRLCYHSIRDEACKTVASTFASPHEANARLIAAAPEMLKALKEIMRRAVYNPEYNDWEIVMKESFLQHNVQLIAKAEGSQP